MKLTYPKALMTRRELIEFGIPEIVVDRALRSEYAKDFAQKSGKGRTCKWSIDTSEFDWYYQQECFQD